MSLGDWMAGACFNWLHQHQLVYNACWEDPRLDRLALNLGPNDEVVVITSAGCNALDYALLGPKAIHCVDVNPRQNALLELKVAGIRGLEFGDFFALFGGGYHKHAPALYRQRLRCQLSPWARGFWDRHIRLFHNNGQRPSFYFHGTSGLLAWMVNVYIDWFARVRGIIDDLMAAGSVEDQRSIYTQRLHGVFWNRFMRWAVDRDLTLSMLGVPRAQRRQVEKGYPGGIAQFIEDRVGAVFTSLSLHDNYFWRVYLTGHYTPACCPEYLKEDNFARLKTGLVERLRINTGTLLDFLRRHQGPLHRFVLLDHMDWLSAHQEPNLKKQWQALADRAAPGARLLWRSGGMSVDYVDPIEVTAAGQRCRLGEVLHYHSDLAARLHQQDRVHTYGSFYIADWTAA